MYFLKNITKINKALLSHTYLMYLPYLIYFIITKFHVILINSEGHEKGYFHGS